MPPTRRRSGTSKAGTNQQSTLSFGGTQSRITKPTAAPSKGQHTGTKPTSLETTTSTPKFSTAKDLLRASREGYSIPPPEVEVTPEAKAGSTSQSQSQSPTSEKEEEEVETKTLPHHPAPAPAPTKPLSETESRALNLTTPDLQEYWSSLESSRKAPRVHQEHTSLSEKILRHFDLSSEYGPCIGITRLERWKRAERLGLSPKVEVLAVLLKGEGKGESRFDELLA